MAQLIISDSLFTELQGIATRKGCSVEELLTDYVQQTASTSSPVVEAHGLTLAQIQTLISEYMTELINVHAPDGTWIYCSPSILALTGYTPGDLYGKDPYTYVHPDDRAAVQASHVRALEKNHVASVTFRFRLKDGSYRWLETSTAPLLDDAGNLRQLITVTHDMTSHMRTQQELKDERDLLSLIMRTSPSGINVVDHSGRIIYTNPRSDAILGATTDEILSRTYDAPSWKHTDFDGNPWPDEQQPFVRVMATRAPVWNVQHAIEWSDGRKVYLSINGAPILDEQGEVSKVVFTIDDVTERKHQQDELRAALEREKALNRMRADFVSLVSHEFRTPLTIIMTSIELLRMKRSSLTEEEMLKRLDKIEAQIHRLTDLLSDVTFINKGDVVGHRLTLSTIDLDQFFTQIADEVQTAYTDREPITLQREGDCNLVELDLGLMQQVFVNLLSNAMKYTPVRAQVVCRYQCSTDTLSVTIQDNGIGIPPDDQAHLFGVFYRASNASGFPGTGLGLAIVKRAVHALGGMITFESALQVGTTFRVILPLHPPVFPT